MASLGTVTSLGVGSGFELQKMLEEFRAIDEIPITGMKDEITAIKERLTKYDEIKAKLLEIKAHALTLSLESNFIERNVAVSDEEIVSATAIQGSTLTSTTLEVTRLASRSSWQTAGVATADTSVYIPTVQNSTQGFDDPDQAAAVTENGLLILTYGSGETQKTIGVGLTAGMTLDQMAAAVNTDSENSDGAGGTLLTAATFQGEDGQYYLRLAATAAGSSEANRVGIAESPEEFSFEAPKVAFSIQVGSADPVIIEVAADTTFNELAAQINEDGNNPGVTAGVINDGTGATPYRLVITAGATGEDSRIQISGIQMTEVQGAEGASLNAEISLDGILYQRQSNSGLTDIIQGLTLELKKEGEVSISVSANQETIRTEIIGLVTSYNELVQDIKASSAYDKEEEKWGVLAAAYSIKGLPNQLNGLIGAVTGSVGSVNSLYDLGMGINRDGTISIDEEVLDSALAAHPDDVADFFLSDPETGKTGLADLLNEHLRSLTGNLGLIGQEKTYAEESIDRLEKDIEATTARLDERYDVLARQFVELDRYAASMKNLGDYLTSAFNSMQSSGNNNP
ncbi:MAG: flagellar filament capping protein FliD [Thermodesulfobacteriota bacterium]